MKTIIIGGGLAGLAAAYRFAGRIKITKREGERTGGWASSYSIPKSEFRDISYREILPSYLCKRHGTYLPHRRTGAWQKARMAKGHHRIFFNGKYSP